MAQESIEINKNLLKHLRNQIGETQADTANACFVSLRQYQNIEKSGCTTTKVIKSIANHFDISFEKLITKKDEDDSLWYVTNPHCTFGSVEHGYDKAIQDIKNRSRILSRCFTPRLSIMNGEQVKEISLSYSEDTFCWTMRPLQFNKKIGLIWTQVSDWQKGIWDLILEELLYGCVNDVHIGDSPLVPDNVKPQFIAEFREVGQNKIINKGYRIFKSDVEFRISFTQWLDSLSFVIPSTASETGRLNIAYDFSEEMTKSVNIYRVWLGRDGKHHKAPWPSANIDEVIKTIDGRRNGKIRYAIPIGIGENLESEVTAPMEPEITYNKVTKLPEIELPEITLSFGEE